MYNILYLIYFPKDIEHCFDYGKTTTFCYITASCFVFTATITITKDISNTEYFIHDN